jgi:D-alanyl-D-alanine carboxypeptidase/D-alanyl-D-alanine-endopeptidase (penicillin-binding protein 4)
VVAVLAAVACLALVVGLALQRPWASGADLVAVPTPTRAPEPVAVLSATGTGAPAPTPDGVHDAIDALVRAPELGGRVGASVVDVATGAPLYRRAPDTPIVPASTVKLVTAAAALTTLGPAYRIPTVAVAGQEAGEVVLVGGGDPTLAIDADGFYLGAARLDLLADQVRGSLGGTAPGPVTVDATRFTGEVYGPWDGDIATGGYVGPVTALMTDGARVDPDPEQGLLAAPRWDQPDLAAGRAFARLLGLDAGDVARGTAPAPPEPPPGAPPGSSTGTPPGVSPGASPGAKRPARVEPGAELGRVSSPPVANLVEIMLSTSDNAVAEGLARQVALARGEPASFDGAAAAMEDALDQLGMGLGDGRLVDGSGLSRANRITSSTLTDLLTAAAGEARPRLGGMVAGLPVAGWSGTLADRFRSPQPDTGQGAGYVRAKTGSLAGVNTLAGLVVTADGRLLSFALLADGVPADETTARAALDRIAAALAGCGCR